MKKAVVLFVLIAMLFGQAVLAEAWGRHGFHHFGHHRFFVGTTVFVGPGFWGPPWWGGYYWYPPVYQPPVVIQQPPQVYIQPSQPAPPPAYWYYCPDSKAYYPYVQQCPQGWLQVVPRTGP